MLSGLTASPHVFDRLTQWGGGDGILFGRTGFFGFEAGFCSEARMSQTLLKLISLAVCCLISCGGKDATAVAGDADAETSTKDQNCR